MFFGTLTHPLSMNANLSQVGNGNRPQWRPRKLLHEVTPPYRYSVQRVQGKTLVAHCAPEPGATDRLFSGQSAEVRPATDRLSSVVLFVGLHSFSHFLPRISPARSSKPATFGPLRLQSCASQHRWHRRASANGLILEGGYTVVLRHYRRIHFPCNGPLNNCGRAGVRRSTDRLLDGGRPTGAPKHSRRTIFWGKVRVAD